MDEKALSTLHLSFVDAVFYNIANESTPTKLWKKLKDFYQTKSLMNKLYLQQQLYTLWMQELTSTHKQLNEFNKVVAQLTNIGANLDDENKVMICYLHFWQHTSIW